MKKIAMMVDCGTIKFCSIIIVCCLASAYTSAQTVFWSEDFTSGGAGWTLNLNGPGTNDFYANEWVINSDYSACTQCGTSGGNLLHITCNSLDATFCPLFGGPSCVYNAGGIDPILTDKYTSSPDISTVGYSNITLKFWYQSFGQSGGDYGKVRLSNDGGATWTDLVTNYAGNASCIQASIAIPAIYENITNFRIAFRWVNNDNSNGNDPPFSVDDVQLSVPAGCAMTVSVTASPNSVCQGQSTTLDAAQAGGTGSFTYSWTSTPAGFTSSVQSPTANPSSTTTYNVTVTDGSACTAAGNVTVTVNSAPTLSPTSTPATCGSNNGTADANASGGTPPYTCLWSDAQTTCSAIGLSSGTFTVTVTDNAGCTASSTVAVSSSGGPSVSVSSTNTDCGLGTGTATTTASGGNPPYTYLWSDSQTNSIATGLTAGNYTITVTDNSGCSNTGSTTVSSNAGPSVSMSNTSTSCSGSTGTATATATGGTTPYSYIWSNSQTASTASGLAAATYTVTVTDAGGCTITGSTSVNSTSGPSVSMASTATSCSGSTGMATATATGGTTPYSYLWSNSQTASTASGLAAGNYTVTVTDASGCTITGNTTVNTTTGPSVSTAVTNTGCGSSTGTATANASGGTPSYTYVWSNSQSTSTITGLAAGTYTVTVSDASGCSVTGTAIVGSGSSPSVTTSSTAASCSASDGTATASVTGGTPPYTYSWNDPASQTSSTATGLGAGNYSVSVTDAGGCTATGSVSVTSPGSPSLTTSSTNATCGSANGSATVNASGSTPPYTYAWSNGQTASNATGLIAGDYTVTVTGSGGGQTAFWSEDFTSGGTGWTLNLSSGTNDANANEWIINSDYSACTQCGTSGGNLLHITCNSADVSFCPLFGGPSCVYNAGGIDPIQTDKFVSSPDISTVGYSNITLKFWYGSNGESGSDYGQVRLSNDGGATWNDLATQYAGVPVCLNPSITIPAAYENITNFRIGFRWINNDNSNGADPPFSVDDIQLLVTAGSGCPSTATVTVGQTNNLPLTITTTTTSCGTPTGKATATPNGTPPYTYNWSNSQTGSEATGLAAGTYTVTVTDGAGCTASANATITSSGGPIINLATNPPMCAGGSNGMASVAASGGTSPYTYAFSSGQTGTFNGATFVNGLSAGSYTITVTDAGSCSVVDTTAITDPAAITIDFTIQNADCGVNNGAATATPSNGTPPYQYQWSNGVTTQVNFNVGAGTYFLTVTDNNGCKSSDTAIISNLNAPVVNITSVTDIDCYGDMDGSVTTNVSGGTPPYTYSWSNGATTQNLSGVGAGNYVFTVTDNDGCITIMNATITQPTELILSVSGTNAICGGTPGQAAATVSGGTPGYTFSWSNSSIGSVVSGISGGTYTVTVTDTLGCSKTSSATITDSSAATVDAGNDTTLFAGTSYTVTATPGGGIAPWEFTWMPGNKSGETVTLSPTETTTYSVTATDANSCSANDSLIITVLNCVEPFIPSAFSPNNDLNNDILFVRGFTDDCVESMTFVVYNRWGQKIFETNTTAKGWDGTSKGKNLDAGVFVFYMKAIWKGGEEKTLKGNVTLVR